LKILKTIFLKKKIKSYIQEIKGYKKCHTHSSISIIDIKNEISEVNYLKSKNLKIKFLKNVNFNRVIQQVLYEKIIQPFKINNLFFKSIYNKKKLIYYLHTVWYYSFEKRGCRINKILSNILFNFFIFSRVFKAILYLIKVIKCFKNTNNHVSFVNLYEDCVSDNIYDKNFVNWYVKKHNIVNKNISINVGKEFKNSNNFIIENFLYSNLNIINKLLLIAYFIYFFSLSFFYYLIGNKYYLLLFEEVLIARKFYLQKTRLSKKYIFLFHDNVYRPLWTYIAEKFSSDIEMFNYAGSFGDIQKKNLPYPKSINFFKILTWPHLQLYSQNLRNYYFNLNRKINFILHPRIDFFDSNFNFKINHKNSLAFFDGPPLRDFFRAEAAAIDSFTTEKNCIKLFQDIIDISEELGIHIYYKPKRELSPFKSKHYLKFINNLRDNKFVTILDYKISPQSLIEKVKAVVSRPYTSPSLIGNKLKKPSIFYDPIGYCDPNDPGSQGLKTIYQKDALRKWLSINF